MNGKNNSSPLEKKAVNHFARVRVPSSMRAAKQMRGFSILPGERTWKEEQVYRGKKITVSFRVVSLTEESPEGYRDSDSERDRDYPTGEVVEYLVPKRGMGR